MTEPSEYARSIAVQFFGHPEHGALREALAQVVDAVRAVVRREALMDAATALHDLPTPQVGQHPECIVLALLAKGALADHSAPAAPPEPTEAEVEAATEVYWNPPPSTHSGKEHVALMLAAAAKVRAR